MLGLSCCGCVFEGCNTGFYELNPSSCKGLTVVQKVGRRLLEALAEKGIFFSTFYNLNGCAYCPALAVVAFPKSKRFQFQLCFTELFDSLSCQVFAHILKFMKP